jgi:hypothetical protein
MPEQFIEIQDSGETFRFTWASLYAYCGPTQIIASALMFRLFEKAIADLSPASVPERKEFQFLSGFPGRGIAECVELVTRLTTLRPRGFVVDALSAPPQAPSAGEGGFLYFEVQIGGRRKGYWPPSSFFDDTFRTNVSLYQNGSGGEEAQGSYHAYKKNLSTLILKAPPENFFSFRDVEALPALTPNAP